MVNLFSPIESHFPAAQVQTCTILGGDLIDTKIVGKIRTAARRRLIATNGPQPIQRSLQKSIGRHEYDRKSGVHRLQNASDQPHVVIGRQPDDTLARRRMPIAPGDDA